ncbi:MAG TPA: tetratricopeptide repeat protein [Pseudohaliea sp.]|nr:tetratricopeptide repeat protein [Pseudohaliea sp.]
MMRRAALLALLLGLAAWLGPDRPRDWLASPAQQAQRLFDTGRFEAAAARFADPLRRGNAWYRAGAFERAAIAYALVTAPEGAFNRGNALLMQGDYAEAIEAYDEALGLVPGWAAAATNRAIAEARQARLAAAAKERDGASEIGADDVVFDAEAGDRAAGEAVTDDAGPGDEALRALWLRRVSTRPGDFLSLRFAAQLAAADGEDAP